MKIHSKILIISISFAVIQIFLVARFIHQIAYTNIQQILTENAKNPQEEKVVVEILGKFTHEMIKSLIPIAIVILLFISSIAIAIYLYLKRIMISINHHLITIINFVSAHQSFYEDSGSGTLPNCIIELLKGAFQLSQLDLTVEIPTHNKMMAPLADTINKMAMEISKRLLNIRTIVEKIEITSNHTKKTSENISTLIKTKQYVAENIRVFTQVCPYKFQFS